MAAPRWQFILCSYFTYEPQGEIRYATNMQLNRRLNGLDTMSFQVRSDNPLFGLLATGRGHVKAYRNGVLQAVQTIWSIDINGADDKESIAVNCYSPGKFMEYSLPSYQWYALETGGADRGALLSSYASLSYDPSNLDRQFKNTVDTNFTTPYFVPYKLLGGNSMTFKQEALTWPTMAELLATFSAGLDGFDWYWQPTEPTIYRQIGSVGNGIIYPGDTMFPGDDYSSLGMRVVAKMEYAPKIGSPLETVFEYGMGRSALSGFKLAVTRDNQANRLYQKKIEPPIASDPDQFQDVWVSNPTSANFWGRMQATTDYDVKSTDVLKAAMQGTLDLRAEPRRRLEITARNLVGGPLDPPSFGDDYFLGDSVLVRVKLDDGSLLVNGYCRVYAVSFTFTENGSEIAALTIEEGS